MKILVVIVTYRPDLKLLVSNISTYNELVSEIIIWDNTPSGSLINFEGIKVYSMGKNMGLPYAYNFAYKYAKEKGFTHMMTMDQDSEWVGFDKYIQQIEKQSEVALYIVAQNTLVEIPIQEWDHGINSGCMIPIQILDATKGFSDIFFLDLVDEYFHYTVKELGYRIYLVGNCYISHTFGMPKRVSFIFFSILTLNYSPIRLYGIARNNLMLFKRFKVSLRHKLGRLISVFIKTPIKILLVEKNKSRKIVALFMGLIDGLGSRNSRLSHFLD